MEKNVYVKPCIRFFAALKFIENLLIYLFQINLAQAEVNLAKLKLNLAKLKLNWTKYKIDSRSQFSKFFFI